MTSFDQAATPASAPLSRGRSRLLHRLFGSLRFGRLRVELPDGALLEWMGDEPGPDAHLVLRRWRTLWRAMLSGDIGMADAWIDGDWTSPDLTAVVRLAARNSQTRVQPAGDRRVSRRRAFSAAAPCPARKYAARQPPQYRKALRSRQ